MSERFEQRTYRCLDCGETFGHKVKAGDHARQHMPAVGSQGTYDYIEIVPKGVE